MGLKELNQRPARLTRSATRAGKEPQTSTTTTEQGDDGNRMSTDNISPGVQANVTDVAPKASLVVALKCPGLKTKLKDSGRAGKGGVTKRSSRARKPSRKLKLQHTANLLAGITAKSAGRATKDTVAAKEDEAALVIVQLALGLPVEPNNTLAPEQLDEIANPENLPRVPITTDGYRRSQGELVEDTHEFNDFRNLVRVRTSVMNPANCTADYYSRVLDAAVAKERMLVEEGRIDEKLRPRTEEGKLYTSKKDKREVLCQWYDETLRDIDQLAPRKKREPQKAVPFEDPSEDEIEDDSENSSLRRIRGTKSQRLPRKESLIVKLKIPVAKMESGRFTRS